MIYRHRGSYWEKNEYIIFIVQRYFQGAHGALLLYDCTRPVTLDSIVNWQKELNERVYQRNGNPLPTILIGTKVMNR